MSGRFPRAVKYFRPALLPLVVEGQPHLPCQPAGHALRGPFPHRKGPPLAERFGTRSGQYTDKFADIDVDTDETGVPLLRQCPNQLLLERIAVLDDGGDHVCITARVRSSRTTGAFTPLRLSEVTHLDPGHASEERAIQP